MENKLRLSKNIIDYLEELPENGNGYQIVDVELNNGEVLKNRIVFNSSFLQLGEREDLSLEEIKEIKITQK